MLEFLNKSGFLLVLKFRNFKSDPVRCRNRTGSTHELYCCVYYCLKSNKNNNKAISPTSPSDENAATMSPMFAITPVVLGNRTSITTNASISVTPSSVKDFNPEEMVDIVSLIEAILISPFGEREFAYERPAIATKITNAIRPTSPPLVNCSTKPVTPATIFVVPGKSISTTSATVTRLRPKAITPFATEVTVFTAFSIFICVPLVFDYCSF